MNMDLLSLWARVLKLDHWIIHQFWSFDWLGDHEISAIIKHWIIVKCNSSDLIGLAAMVYEPLCYAREIATIKLSSGHSCNA